MAMDGLPTFVALQISAGGYKEFPELRQADTHIVNVHPKNPLTEIHLVVAGEYHMMGLRWSRWSLVQSHILLPYRKKHLRYFFPNLCWSNQKTTFWLTSPHWPTNQISQFRCSRHFVAVRS
jgi:hypothetical protein